MSHGKKDDVQAMREELQRVKEELEHMKIAGAPKYPTTSKRKRSFLGALFHLIFTLIIIAILVVGVVAAVYIARGGDLSFLNELGR